MFGIKLKGFKKSGKFNDLNRAYSSLTITPPLNGVIRGQPVFIAIFCINANNLMGPLGKYNFIVFSKCVFLNPDKIMVPPFKCIIVLLLVIRHAQCISKSSCSRALEPACSALVSFKNKPHFERALPSREAN